MPAFYRVSITLLSLLVFQPRFAQSQSAALKETRKLQSSKKYQEALMEATRYMEAAKISQPKNLNILNALKLFYDKVGMHDKHASIIQEIEALKG